jgi:isoquinoline 1-oxidoreductase beta subunit
MSEPQQQKSRWRMSRRGFLIGTGIVGGGLALGASLGLPALRLFIADALDGGGGPPGSISSDPQLWFAIDPDGQVTMAMPKVEMGQGIHTAIAQIGAEELGIAWEQVRVVQSSSIGPVRDPSGTSASNSVVSLYNPLRETAATMREMLRREAAARLGVAPAALAWAPGAFFVTAAPEQRLGYGEIVAGAGEWEVPEEAPVLTSPADFRLIGKSMPRVDLADKIAGTAVYGYDVRVEGMAYGVVARPPSLGARLRRAGPGTAAEQPGVLAVVAEEGFAGIVATSRALAFQALSAMELEWDETEPLQQEQIDAAVTVGRNSPVAIQQVGNAGSVLDAGQVIEAAYRTPLAAHASLEPQAALVDVRPDRVIALVSTQSPVTVAGDIARALGRDASEVEVTPAYLGAGLGRKLNVEVAIEAARLSAAAGVPVHVGWTRTEEFREGYLRPPTHSVLRASLDADGQIQAIEHRQASGDVLFSLIPAPLQFLFGADFGAWRGARISYAIPNILTSAERVKLPIRTGAWRGLGLLANVFAVESFIDELAHTAGIDPLAFRLRHYGDAELGPRFRAVLEDVAARSNWGTPAPAGRARGIACCVDAGTVVAHVAEVSLSDTGQIRVHKVWAAVDPGLVINPDGAIAQSEGNIIMGLSATLLERITVRDGKIEATNFNRYPLLTIRDAPDVEVVLISSGDQPFGMGEPPMGPIAAAVANAVFALTGRRLRELPLSLS